MPPDLQELFFALALDDVRAAARELRPTFDASDGRDGFISFECTPDLADDTEATITQATELWRRLGQPNAMIKVPATRAGLPAIEELTRRGINVNVTLLFAIDRYEEVIDAYLRGLSSRAEAGEPLTGIASEWERLMDLGARPQRPLWASTGTKDAAYSDVLYVAELIGPGLINTMPEQALCAFADHGEVADTLVVDPTGAPQLLADAAAAGIDLAAITAALEREGLRSFCDSYQQLLARIESELGAVGAHDG